jgi:hypothetical protein
LTSQGCCEPPNFASIACVPEEEETHDRSFLPVGGIADLLGYGGLAASDISVHPPNVKFAGDHDFATRPGAKVLDYAEPRSSHTGRVWRRSLPVSGMGSVLNGLKEFWQACDEIGLFQYVETS